MIGFLPEPRGVRRHSLSTPLVTDNGQDTSGWVALAYVARDSSRARLILPAPPRKALSG